MRDIVLAVLVAIATIGATISSMAASSSNPQSGVLLLERSAEPTIEMPERIGVGQKLEVTIRTHAPNDCWRMGQTHVEKGDRRVTLHPFDLAPTEDATACSEEPVSFDHTATVTLQQAGATTVEITGRFGQNREPVTFTRRVEVTAQPVQPEG